MSHATYKGRLVSFLTQHGKQDLVRPSLEAALGCRLVHTEGYDTDQLGTFTREVARPGSQIDAARKKARIGIDLTGTRVGLASEGAFGLDPFAGIVPWNTEVLLWVDQERCIEVTGFAHGPAQSVHRKIKTLDELSCFAIDAKSPEYHLSLRPDDEMHPGIRKGLNDFQSLVKAFNSAMAESANGVVFVENDLRAFCNPARQQMIRQASNDLVRKLLSSCPLCGSPGYWVARQVSGLPCRACGMPSQLPVEDVWSCQKCGAEDHRTLSNDELADPGLCDFCNPY